MDEPKQTTERAEGEPQPKSGKKKVIVLGGGTLCVLALAFIASMLAVPKKAKARRFDGPFVSQVSEENISVNLADNDHKRYLQMNLSVEYEAYNSSYFASRLADPLYSPHLMDALQRVTNSRYAAEVTGPINQPIFLQEISRAIDPVIFPVHLGATSAPFARDEESGLRPGYSMPEGTFRGRFFDHVLHVDAVAKTLQIDDGPKVPFDGDETDLEVVDAGGKSIFVNVTEIVEDFKGELQLGVNGQVRRILVSQWILQ